MAGLLAKSTVRIIIEHISDCHSRALHAMEEFYGVFSLKRNTNEVNRHRAYHSKNPIKNPTR